MAGKEKTMRTIKLTHEQVETILNALSIAEKATQKLLLDAKTLLLDTHHIKKAIAIDYIRREFSDMKESIENGDLDV